MIYLKKDFKPKHTFDCGQCFRWNATENEEEYIGVASGRVCRVLGDTVFCPDEDNSFWEEYFCLSIDYEKIKNSLIISDENLSKCVKYGDGIRLLRQDIWETIVSFIISANNNIPRIKKIIEAMCSEFGELIKSDISLESGERYYSFPSPEKLNSLDISDLSILRAGYRDKYLMDAANKVVTGEVNLDGLDSMSTPDAKIELMKIKGIGGKVADCILLFSMGRYDVFPKDVWIKRILFDVYGIIDKNIDGFVQEKYAGLAGYAQQYLYYYYRDNDIA